MSDLAERDERARALGFDGWQGFCDWWGDQPLTSREEIEEFNQQYKQVTGGQE